MTETELRSKNKSTRGERWVSLILIVILAAGAGLRFYNVNWDEGTYHIHPDERSTTMVLDRLEWPSSFVEYFDTSHSPLNARNVGMVYFYGTFPLYLTKAVASAGEALQTFYAEMQPDPGEYWRAHPPLTGYDRIHLVGRVLSGLFDLGTVILTFFLARRLFDWRVGLIAAALLTFTVLNIQGSHYFAVDTFLTFFVALTLWFALDVAEGGNWQSFVNLGLAMGLTMATKVSVFLLVAVIALAGWVRIRRLLHEGESSSEAALAAVSGLILAAVVAVGVFRIAQPYAWAGPNYDGWQTVPDPWRERMLPLQAMPEPLRAAFMPNPQWIADIMSAGAQQTGEADLPWGRQWTERAPWLWPLENMILWTVGVPLGVTAWLGVALATVLVALAWWRRRPNPESRIPSPESPISNPQSPIPNPQSPNSLSLPNWDLILIPLAWVLLSFGWQGMQYVKSVRYFLPIHPYLAMFAAFLLVAAWDWVRGRRLVFRLAVAALGTFVVAGTILWAFAFIQIYTEPVTRVQATEWIYQNVESGATLRYRTPDGAESQLQLPVPSTQVYATNRGWYLTPFTPPTDLTATENNLSGENGPVAGAFEVRITTGNPSDPPFTGGHIEAVFGDPDSIDQVVDVPDASLAAGQTYYFEGRAVQGAPLIATGALLRYLGPDGQPGEFYLPLVSPQVYATDQGWQSVAFVPPTGLVATEIVMNDLSGQNGPVEGAFEVQITTGNPAELSVTMGQVEAVFGDTGGWSQVIDLTDVPLTAGQTYYFEAQALAGGPFVASRATLRYLGPDDQPGELLVPLSPQVYATNEGWQSVAFVAPADLTTTEIVMNDLSGENGAVEGAFEVRITANPGADAPLAQGLVSGILAGKAHARYVIDVPDVELQGGQTYYFQGRALEGAPLVSRGAVIANEHFDDALPFSMFGYASFGGSGLYRSLDVHYPGDDRRIDQLQLYDEDTPEKLQVLLDSLDQADYIIMSSGRLWQSIPRLPMRYPMTTRYYELLFAEELGFEKAAEFHSYPRLFGIEFDDTWAEEQFTVYDHPKVLIYHKTDDYDRARIHRLLSAGIDWNDIPRWLNPRDVPEWRREQATLQRTGADRSGLMLGKAQWEMQQASGTWASIFDRNSVVNRLPTLSWLLLLAVVGLAALPLTTGVFGRLPDRGYILARPVGVLLLAWLAWILTNLTPLQYTRGTIALALGLIAAASGASLLLPAQRQRLRDLWARRRLVLVAELLFLAAFALFWVIRWGNPDLWHPWKGGEKPMDFAYLNAVIKSVEFPPYDPWFAGGYLNYYYFGQVMAGTLIKLIGIVPNIAYNLVVPAWFAMTATGAFSVTYNLVARRGGSEGGEVRVSRHAILFGLVGALFVAVLGNLAEVHLILLKLGEGVLEGFDSTIPGLAGLVRTLIGTIEVFFGGRALPIAIDQWYWNASRAIPGTPWESVITEFPFFTYLYADLHAHLLAMPLTFLSLSVALAVVLCTRRTGWRGVLAALPRLLLWALAIGAMRTTNTWDVPPHLILVFGALVISAIHDPDRSGWQRLAGVAWQLGLVLVLSWWLLYKPFWDSYGAFYNSITRWEGTRTPLWAYLVVHGLFLFTIASYLFARVVGDRRRDPLLRRAALSLRYRGRQARRLARAARIARARNVPISRVFWLAVAVLVLIELLLLMPALFEFTRPNQEALLAGTHAYRGLVVFALGLPLALVGLLLLFRPRISARERLWAYLVLLALAMSMGVEVVVVEGDIGRMNTVFKFYLQVWLVWGVAAATALAWMVPRLRHWRFGQGAWIGVLVALLFFAALYPPLATSAKVRDRFEQATEPGLDGWQYMETSVYWDPVGAEWGHDGGVHYDLKWDLEAIRWLLDNVVGTPVILEGHVPEYRWGARYSINTGLPTVIGWNWHQRQQRAAADQQAIWDRAADVRTIYDLPSIAAVEPLLEKYDVRYVIVGPLERAYYDEVGLNKFDWMVREGKARAVFANDGVTIYELIR